MLWRCCGAVLWSQGSGLVLWSSLILADLVVMWLILVVMQVDG